MAWWDHEELKDPTCRSDRYIVSFPDEYTKDEVAAAQRRLDKQGTRNGKQDISETVPVTVPSLYAENIKLRQRVKELEKSLAARKGLHEGAVLAMTTHVKKLEETQYKIDVRKEYNRLNLIHLLTRVRNFPNFAHHYGASMCEEIDAVITEMQEGGEKT